MTEQIAVPEVKMSMALGDMTLDELVQLSQSFGHKVEELRRQRAYLQVKIAERLALGERTGDTDREQGRARLLEALAKAGNGDAPGADIVIQAKG